MLFKKGHESLRDRPFKYQNTVSRTNPGAEFVWSIHNRFRKENIGYVMGLLRVRTIDGKWE